MPSHTARRTLERSFSIPSRTPQQTSFLQLVYCHPVAVASLIKTKRMSTSKCSCREETDPVILAVCGAPSRFLIQEKKHLASLGKDSISQRATPRLHVHNVSAQPACLLPSNPSLISNQGAPSGRFLQPRYLPKMSADPVDFKGIETEAGVIFVERPRIFAIVCRATPS